MLFTACITLTSILFAQIPSKGLVAQYNFTGNAKDSSGNAYDGTVNNATLTTDRFGNANAAYSFNGTNTSIDIPITGLKNDNFSYSLWVNANSIPTPGTYYLCLGCWK